MANLLFPSYSIWENPQTRNMQFGYVMTLHLMIPHSCLIMNILNQLAVNSLKFTLKHSLNTLSIHIIVSLIDKDMHPEINHQCDHASINFCMEKIYTSRNYSLQTKFEDKIFLGVAYP